MQLKEIYYRNDIENGGGGGGFYCELSTIEYQIISNVNVQKSRIYLVNGLTFFSFDFFCVFVCLVCLFHWLTAKNTAIEYYLQFTVKEESSIIVAVLYYKNIKLKSLF